MLRSTWVLWIVFGAAAARADTVVATDTGEAVYTTLPDLGFACQPGIASTGHNYPTASSFVIYDFARALAAKVSNLSSIGAADPKMRLGDHCADLERELTNLLPRKLSSRRRSTAGAASAGDGSKRAWSVSSVRFSCKAVRCSS